MFHGRRYRSGANSCLPWATALGVEPTTMASLLRDIYHFPSQPVFCPASWLAEVGGIAEEIYQERAFGRMPELGDALEKAGCRDKSVLTHCREPMHVRGCWVIDML